MQNCTNCTSEQTTLPILLRQMLPLNYEYQLVNYNEIHYQNLNLPNNNELKLSTEVIIETGS